MLNHELRPQIQPKKTYLFHEFGCRGIREIRLSPQDAANRRESQSETVQQQADCSVSSMMTSFRGVKSLGAPA